MLSDLFNPCFSKVINKKLKIEFQTSWIITAISETTNVLYITVLKNNNWNTYNV